MCKVGRFCIPQMQKCCFVLPLKKGLKAWGFFKLVFHVILMFYALMLLIRFKQLAFGGYTIVVGLFIFIIIDIIMNIIFLKATQEDNYKQLIHYYYYVIVLLVLYTFLFIIFTVLKMITDGDFFYNWPFLLQDCVIGSGNFALQFYFSELVKSHINNLRYGYDPEIESLYEDSSEDEDRVKEKKKRHRKPENNDDTKDHDDNTSEVDDEKKKNEIAQVNEDAAPDKDDQEADLREIH